MCSFTRMDAYVNNSNHSSVIYFMKYNYFSYIAIHNCAKGPILVLCDYPLVDLISVSVLCHMRDFGCGEGGWTPVMKIDGRKVLFLLFLFGFFYHFLVIHGLHSLKSSYLHLLLISVNSVFICYLLLPFYPFGQSLILIQKKKTG